MKIIRCNSNLLKQGVKFNKSSASQPDLTQKPDIIATVDGAIDLQKFDASAIQNREKLISRLLDELDSRTDGIRKIGKDLYAVRDLNAKQEKEIEQLKAKLDDVELRTNKLVSISDLDLLSLEELQRRYVVIVDRLQRTMDVNRQLAEENILLKDGVEGKAEIERRLAILTEAHTAQQALVLKLQESSTKVENYTKVIKKQERVIEKFETLLSSIPRDIISSLTGLNRSMIPATPRYPTKGEEAMELEVQLDITQKQLASVTKERDALRRDIKIKNGGDTDTLRQDLDNVSTELDKAQRELQSYKRGSKPKTLAGLDDTQLQLDTALLERDKALRQVQLLKEELNGRGGFSSHMGQESIDQARLDKDRALREVEILKRENQMYQSPAGNFNAGSIYRQEMEKIMIERDKAIMERDKLVMESDTAGKDRGASGPEKEKLVAEIQKVTEERDAAKQELEKYKSESSPVKNGQESKTASVKTIIELNEELIRIAKEKEEAINELDKSLKQCKTLQVKITAMEAKSVILEFP